MAATAATSDVSDGPVLSVFNKRLRALRKKLNRITQMEESIAQGKQLNKEQEEVLRSKPSVTVAIDELEKLRQPLTAAVAEEIDLATKRRPPPVSEKEGDSEEAKKDKVGDEVEKSGAETLALEDLLSLIYFAHMFDVKSLQSDFNSIIVTRTHERECCLSYDYVGDDDANVMLGETDLDLISMMGKLLISRPVDSSSSHENALRRCIEHAKLWLEKSEQPIDVNSGVTYLSLREKLAKIMRSEYVKIVPEMKPTTDIAASAAGNYVSLKVPPATTEGSVQYEQKDEGVADFQTSETSENQSSPGEEPHKDYSQAENPAEFQIQSEPGEQHVAGGGEFREPQRRSYYNQRSGGRNGGGGGGRRGGYSNGRGGRGGGRGGGGPYQNGRNQYYDQPGNYYQGNNYYHNNNRGRVNRGASGNGGNAYNHASGVPVADS